MPLDRTTSVKEVNTHKEANPIHDVVNNATLEILDEYSPLDKYIFKEYDKNLLFNRIYHNIDFLRKNAEYIAPKKKYEYRPDLVAYEYMGSKAAAWVIMVINRIDSIFNFKRDNFYKGVILIPNKNDLLTLLRTNKE